jgi:nitrogen-specific signal transduction histidine kinase
MLTNTLEAKVAERTRALEESQLALQRTARLEALGRLAGGIAHDINNLLMGIVGYAELLENSLDPRDERREDILEIRKAVDRGARLTRQLLAFARKQPSRPAVLDPFALVTDLDRLLRRLIGSDIQLVVERTGGLGCVRIDPGQLEQVIVNMAVNARDAMPAGGTLRIEVEDRDLSDDDAARIAGARAGAMVRVRVRDSGMGMPPEVLARIFEPFFTTKGEHFGTGLGLATCYGIVNQAGGFVTVASAPNAGTTFDVYLPRTDRAPQWLPATDGVSGPVRGTETILLAEDDAPVREVMAATLQEQGYTVLIASDGLAAVQAAEHHLGPIHLLLTDMMMPGISGLEAAKRIAAVRPALRVLLVSGYVPDRALPEEGLGLRMAMVPKPVTPLDLTRQVRLLLDEPG